MVEGCKICQTCSVKQAAEELISGEISKHPWDIVHQDLLEWQDQQYEVTVDGFSDYFHITRLGRTATVNQIVAVTKELFAAYGRPGQFRTDSDPKYLSDAFQTFLKQWKVEHKWSSPHFHSSNGKAESAVKIAKRLIKKTILGKADLEFALLQWRNTPQKDGPSPSQKFLCLTTRSFLPATQKGLQPRVPGRVVGIIRKRREEQKRQHDGGTINLPRLEIGERVRIPPINFDKEWKVGTLSKALHNRTYEVRQQNGKIIRRNRRHLRKAPLPEYREERKSESGRKREEAFTYKVPFPTLRKCTASPMNNNLEHTDETTPPEETFGGSESENQRPVQQLELRESQRQRRHSNQQKTNG